MNAEPPFDVVDFQPITDNQAQLIELEIAKATATISGHIETLFILGLICGIVFGVIGSLIWMYHKNKDLIQVCKGKNFHKQK